MAEVRSLCEFANCSEGKLQSVAYGIVVDASRPCYKPHNNKYVATMKVIDDTWSLSKHPLGFAPFVKLVFISPNREHIPQVTTVGTIIQFQDGLLRRISEGQSQTLLITWDGALSRPRWELYDGCGTAMGAAQWEGLKQEPVKVLPPAEEKRVVGLRKFQERYFTECMIVDMKQNLRRAKTEGKEFDTVVKLVSATLVTEHHNKNYILTLEDHTQDVQLTVPQSVSGIALQQLQTDSLLLLKGAYFTDLEHNNVELKDYGNLLLLPTRSLVACQHLVLANELMPETCGDTWTDVELLPRCYKVSQIAEPGLQLNSLKDVMQGVNKAAKQRLQLRVVEIGPRSVKDWVRSYCASCNASFPLEPSDPDTDSPCKVCTKGCRPIYQLQLLVKDWDDSDADIVHKVLLYTHNGKGEEFFDNRKPQNVHKSSELCQLLKSMYKLLTRYGVCLECVVERMSPDPHSFFQLSSTVVSSKYFQPLPF